MAVQNRANLDSTPFILYSYPGVREDDAVLLQDAGRATPLLQFTLMAKVAATGKWVPFTNEAAVDGTAIPQGIYLGDDIPAADIVAGDVVDLPIVIAGVRFDANKLVIENSKLLTTVITIGTTDLRSVFDHLVDQILIPENTINIARAEN